MMDIYQTKNFWEQPMSKETKLMTLLKETKVLNTTQPSLEFDRIDFYKEQLKNTLPSDSKITRQGNQIIVEISLQNPYF